MSINQDGQLTSSQSLWKIVESFPQENLVYAFGYGSGVFSQTLVDDKEKHEGMLDMILVVDDSYEFHNANLQNYPHHYAKWLQYSGPSMIDRIQRNFLSLKDACVLFHIVDDPVPMKYGVVRLDDLLRDLTQWESLYLAGRLHKPTLSILAPSKSPPDQFVEAQASNLQSAVAAALLLLPLPDHSDNGNSLPWLTLYSQIASLSYAGDFRMKVGGEDPNKISKLVQAPGQMERFHALYQPILQPLEKAGILSAKGSSLEWSSRDSATREHLVGLLPSPVRSGATRNHAEFANVLAAIVAPAARNQSLKGVFTFGFRRSIQYASAKLEKGLFRK